MIRRIGVMGSLVLIALLALAGCTSDPEGEYLQSLKENAPRLYADTSSRDLVASGYEACNTLESGYSVAEVMDATMTDGATDWPLIIAAATGHLCSEHKAEFQEWLNAQ